VLGFTPTLGQVRVATATLLPSPSSLGFFGKQKGMVTAVHFFFVFVLLQQKEEEGDGNIVVVTFFFGFFWKVERDGSCRPFLFFCSSSKKKKKKKATATSVFFFLFSYLSTELGLVLFFLGSWSKEEEDDSCRHLLRWFCRKKLATCAFLLV